MSNKDAASQIEMHSQPDFSDVTLVIPSGRLDADQYSADDIDGATESLFGSGNMAYASLQASESDSMAMLNGFSPEAEQNAGLDHEIPTFSGTTFSVYDNTGNGVSFGGAVDPERQIPTDTDRAISSGDTVGTESMGAEGNFSNATVGAVSASTLSSDMGQFLNNESLQENVGGSGDIVINATDVTNQPNIINNSISNTETNIENVAQDLFQTINENIDNVVNLGNDTIEQITNITDQAIENITNTVGDTVDVITNMWNDMVENVFQGDIENIVNDVSTNLETEVNILTDLVTTEINTINETINTEITNVTETINTILENTGVTQILDAPDISLHLDSGVLESAGLQLDAVVNDGIAGNLGTESAFDALASLGNELTGLDLPTVEDMSLNVGFDLLNTQGSAPDGNDVSVSGLEVNGLDVPDVSLDPVESIVGDIDINLDLPSDLSDPQDLLSDVQDLTGSLDDLSLAGAGDALDLVGGQGADGALDVNLGENELGESFDTTANDLADQFGGDLTNGVADLSLPEDSVATALLEEVTDPTLSENTLDSTMLEDVTDPSSLIEDLTSLVGDIVEEGSGIVEDTSDLADTLLVPEDLPGIDDVPNVDDAISLISGGDENILLESGVEDSGDLLDTSWTESTIDTGTGLFDDLVDGLSGQSDPLPDPGGSVAEGLGSLNVDPVQHVGGLGGLFG